MIYWPLSQKEDWYAVCVTQQNDVNIVIVLLMNWNHDTLNNVMVHSQIEHGNCVNGVNDTLKQDK